MREINRNRIIPGAEVSRHVVALRRFSWTYIMNTKLEHQEQVGQVMHCSLCQLFQHIFTYTSDINTSTTLQPENASVVYINY